MVKLREIWEDKKMRGNCIILALLGATVYVAVFGISPPANWPYACLVVTGAVVGIWLISMVGAALFFQHREEEEESTDDEIDMDERYKTLLQNYRVFKFKALGATEHDLDVYREVFKITYPSIGEGNEGFTVEVCPESGRIFHVGYFRKIDNVMEHLDISSQKEYQEVHSLVLEVLKEYADDVDRPSGSSGHPTSVREDR